MFHTVVEGFDLNDAWRNALWACVRNGIDYKIASGSYVGQIRKQLYALNLIVLEPWKKPMNFYTPIGIPEPTNHDKIQKYFYEYIATDTKCEQEDYTYGEFIAPQIPTIIEILNKAKGMTNQATINIGGVNNIYMEDPPCLRVLDFKVINNELVLSAFFRSWDLFTGLPENLGGLQLLKEYILMHLNFPIKDGKMIIYSSGAHLYEMYFPIVNQMNVEQIDIRGE